MNAPAPVGLGAQPAYGMPQQVQSRSYVPPQTQGMMQQLPTQYGCPPANYGYMGPGDPAGMVQRPSLSYTPPPNAQMSVNTYQPVPQMPAQPTWTFPPGSRVRLKGVTEGSSPYAGVPLVVSGQPPDHCGRIRVEVDGTGGAQALLIAPGLLEPADMPQQQQFPAPAPCPATWLEGGHAVAQSGFAVGDQVQLRGVAANSAYHGKLLTVEAADVGDGTGRVRVVIQHDTHVSRLAFDPSHLELVQQGGDPGQLVQEQYAVQPGEVVQEQYVGQQMTMPGYEQQQLVGQQEYVHEQYTGQPLAMTMPGQYEAPPGQPMTMPGQYEVMTQPGQYEAPPGHQMVMTIPGQFEAEQYVGGDPGYHQQVMYQQDPGLQQGHH